MLAGLLMLIPSTDVVRAFNMATLHSDSTGSAVVRSSLFVNTRALNIGFWEAVECPPRAQTNLWWGARLLPMCAPAEILTWVGWCVAWRIGWGVG